MKPLIVRGRLRFPIPAFIPTAAYATAEGADMSMKNAPRGKQMPKGQARPLGTKKPKSVHRRTRLDAEPSKAAIEREEQFEAGKESVEEISADVQNLVDSDQAPEVDLHQQSEPQAIQQADGIDEAAKEQQTMTLTFKNLSKNGKNAFYTGAATVLRFALSAFPGKQYPSSFEVAEGIFAAKVVKEPKVKMTAEERKAFNASKPKPTLAEKAAAAQKRADALAAKLAAKLAASNDL